MEIVWWCGSYLALAVFCWYSFYFQAVDFNFRLDVRHDEENESLWQSFILDNKGVLKLLILDFLKIHCPWSKAVSIQYRVQEAHKLLQNSTHEKGWKVEDCHNPTNHRQIAKDCFQSRTRFWAENIFNLLSSPLRLAALFIIAVVVGLIVLPIISLWQRATAVFRK